MYKNTNFSAIDARFWFNFFSIDKPQRFERNKGDGQVSAGNDQPSPSYTYWFIPRNIVAADIR